MLVDGLLPDRFTFPSLFKATEDLSLGKQLHCHSMKFGFASDAYVQNTLMYMYSICGCLISAQKVFDKMLNRNMWFLGLPWLVLMHSGINQRKALNFLR